MSTATLATVDLQTLNRKLNDLPATDRVRWAKSEFGGGLVMSTSFGVQSAVLLHLVTRVIPDIPVIFVDTGYLFAETYQFAEHLRQRLELNLHIYQPLTTAARQEALHGKRWEQEPEALAAYNFENKVEPMNRALMDFSATAWISGLRRVQASSRQHLRVLERQRKMMKIHPIIEWSEREIYTYLSENGLPYHPLWEQGYVSVGDVHSTSKLEPGMNPEDTRFGGVKRECGLHESSGRVDFQI